MPSKIEILKPELTNRIAAGEVVQRPAAAVKELIENALDAQATSITVLVKASGSELVHVIDDGEGMTEGDAVLAFQRHATSKVHSPEDLENILTLGFRGEALASIAAVSQVELKTRTKDEEVATLVRIEANDVKEVSKTNAPIGTSVAVRNLFFNTPARRNFLKSKHTELKNITDVVTRMAIIYPEIAWHYESDEEVLLDVKPTTSEERLHDIFGPKQFGGLVKFNEKSDYMTIDGYLGKPDFARRSRADQYFYLNRRTITNRAIQHAAFQAYEHLLEKGAYPFLIVNLIIDPHKVDVNVHPSKMEVKFENESHVYRHVLGAVRKTLATNDLVPSATFSPPHDGDDTGVRFNIGTRPASPFFSGFRRSTGADSAMATLTEVPPIDQMELERVFKKIESHLDEGLAVPMSGSKERLSKENIVEHQARATERRGESEPEVRAIWQIHNKYILSQIRGGLLIIDQHVAHERILYERVLGRFENSLPSSQQLLFPQTLSLPTSEYLLVTELMPHLERLGFDIKLFGKNTVVIEGIPSDVRVGNESKILQDLLDEFKNNEHHATMDVRDNLAKSFACKAAIKAGDKLNTGEMISLIDQLFATTMPYVCPHGRPVVVKIPIEELDRRFGRT